MSDQPLYSTSGGDQRKNKGKNKGNKGSAGAETYKQGNGPCKIRLEKKKRGGKLVTVISDIPLGESDARDLLKFLKGKLACGGALKGSNLELQGDVSTRVHEILLKDRQMKSKVC